MLRVWHVFLMDHLTMQVLQFVHRCAAQLGDAGESAEMALQLFLTAAYSASEHAKSELIAYEFFEQVKPCRIGQISAHCKVKARLKVVLPCLLQHGMSHAGICPV